jgi:hypothetical protein
MCRLVQNCNTHKNHANDFTDGDRVGNLSNTRARDDAERGRGIEEET